MTWKEKLLAAAFAALAAFLGALGGRLPFAPQPAPPVILPPPVITPIPPAVPQAEIEKTIARIQVGNSGCTAALVGPKRVDRRYALLTASHCVDKIGQRGTYFAQNGVRLTWEVVAIDRTCDCCWGLTDPTDQTFPFGEVSDVEPNVGDEVWHAGYGIDKPGNREVGKVVGGPLSDGKIHYHLNVSSGDSGGAIVSTKTGKILSVVCCAAIGNGPRDTFGSGPTCIKRLRTNTLHDPEWTPIPIPEPGHPKE